MYTTYYHEPEAPAGFCVLAALIEIHLASSAISELWPWHWHRDLIIVDPEVDEH